MSLRSHRNRIKAIHQKLFPLPRCKIWMPQGLMLREENGEYFYLNEEARAIDEKCKRLGVTPNIYIVGDFNPDDDGIEEREALDE